MDNKVSKGKPNKQQKRENGRTNARETPERKLKRKTEVIQWHTYQTGIGRY